MQYYENLLPLYPSQMITWLTFFRIAKTVWGPTALAIMVTFVDVHSIWALNYSPLKFVQPSLIAFLLFPDKINGKENLIWYQFEFKTYYHRLITSILSTRVFTSTRHTVYKKIVMIIITATIFIIIMHLSNLHWNATFNCKYLMKVQETPTTIAQKLKTTDILYWT